MHNVRTDLCYIRQNRDTWGCSPDTVTEGGYRDIIFHGFRLDEELDEELD